LYRANVVPNLTNSLTDCTRDIDHKKPKTKTRADLQVASGTLTYNGPNYSCEFQQTCPNDFFL